MPNFITRLEASRRIQRTPPPPLFPVVLSAEDYPSWLSPQRANRREFSRRVQFLEDRTIAPLNPTPADEAEEDILAGRVAAKQVQRTRQDRQRQFLEDRWIAPQNPSPLLTYGFPAWVPPKANRYRVERRLLQASPAPIWPKTQPGPSESDAATAILGKPKEVFRLPRELPDEFVVSGVIIPTVYKPSRYPAELPPKTFRTSFKRRFQPPGELLVFPATQASPYPSWKGTETNRVAFARKILGLPPSPTHPPTIPDQWPAFLAPLEPDRRDSLERRLLTSPLRFFQRTPATAPHSAFVLNRVNRVERVRRLQPQVEVVDKARAETSQEYPSWLSPKTHRVAFRRSHKAVDLDPSLFQPTARAEDYPAFLAPRTNRVRFSRRRLELANAPIRVPNYGDQGVQSWAPPKTFRTAFSRSHKSVIHAPVRVPAPRVPPSLVAIFRTRFRPETTYTQSAQFNLDAYSEGDMSDSVYKATNIMNDPTYNEGDMSGIIYTDGEFGTQI